MLFCLIFRRQLSAGVFKSPERGQPPIKYPASPNAGTQDMPVYDQEGTRPFDPNYNEYLKTIERQRLMLIGQHPQQHFAPKNENIRWQDGEHIYELPQFDTDPNCGKKDQPQSFQKQSFELSPRKLQPNRGPSQDNLDSGSRNVNNRSV